MFYFTLSILRVYCLLRTFFIHKLKLQKKHYCVDFMARNFALLILFLAGKRNMYRSFQESCFIKCDTKNNNNNNGVDGLMQLEIALTLALHKCFWKEYKTQSVDSELLLCFVCILSRRETEVRIQKIDHR